MASARDPVVPANVAQKIAGLVRAAKAAGGRLIEARPTTWPVPRTMDETLDMIDRMAKTPRKFGVSLSARDKKALRVVHAVYRADRAAKAKEQGPDSNANASGIQDSDQSAPGPDLEPEVEDR